MSQANGKISTVLFDFDGTIVDTETPIFEVWSEVYRRHGVELSLDLWALALGTQGGFDPRAHLVEVTGADLPPGSLDGELRAQIRALVADQPLRPGVEAWIGEVGQAGLRSAVVSSSSVGWVTMWLERHGLGQRFEGVWGRDDVENVKPAPDLYLLAARNLGVEPASCLVIEDTPNGLIAARAAGMRTLAVPNELTRRLELPPHDLRFDSLAEASLLEVLQELSS